MTFCLTSIVDADQVKPYIDRVVYGDFDTSNEIVKSHATDTDTIRDEIMKPALAEFITEITSDREGFPGASQALVDTFFESAMMRIVVGGEYPPANAINRTEAVLDTLGAITKEMIDLTKVMDTVQENKPMNTARVKNMEMSFTM